MQRAANKIDFLTDQSSKMGFADFEIPVRVGKVFQHILTNRLSEISDARDLFTQLTCRSIRFAEHACCLRDWDALEEASLILANIPIIQSRQIGQYYQALTIKRRLDIENSRDCFEKVADKAPIAYRARALQSLGVIHREQSQFDEALRFNLEALRLASTSQETDLLALLMINWEIGIIKSINGDHQGALADFEKLFPLIRLASKQYPFYFYVYHNALAVELSELGRITEAENAISITLASPFAQAYPEWSETRDEIEEKQNYPDPSRCFLDRSIADLNTSLSATTERQAEAASSPQSQSEVETKPLRAIAFHRLIKSITCQRPLTLPNAVKATIPAGVAKSFLQRLGRSVQLRGPPASPLLF